MANAEHGADHAEDVADLRAQLKLVQDRLATYQKFDRDIAENVRRSSELMLETMQVRDRMDRDASEQARARHERLANKLRLLQDDLATVQQQVGALVDRVVALRDEIEPDPDDTTPVAAADTPDTSDVTDSEPETLLATDIDEPAEAEPEPAADQPRTIDLIAHGMTRAASALALQSHLRALSQVNAVDAREFSSGILRLHLDLSRDLTDEDLVGWEGDDDVTILRHLDNAIELRIGE